jgi:hypothetical protein
MLNKDKEGRRKGMTMVKKDGKVTVSVQLTLKQATKAQMESSTFSLTTALDSVGGQRHALAALPPERSDNICIGGWVSSMAGLDGCGKSLPHRDPIPGPFSP